MNEAVSQRQRISELAQLIMEHKRHYYTGSPIISDERYDQLEQELKQLDPQHPALAFVGTDVDSKSEKVEHERPMLSLEKTYDRDDLLKWAESDQVVGMLKIDGNSLSLVYQDGNLSIAKTRGSGRIGELVTQKILWVGAIPRTINMQAKCEIRGELYCSEDNFLKLVADFKNLGLEPPTSPRNVVAGLLGRKTHYNLCRYFNFFAFEILCAYKEWRTVADECTKLEQLGFAVPEPKLCTNATDIDHYLASVYHTMEEGSIGIDGAVFSYNSLALHEELGFTAHHPRYRLSFKWQGATANAEVLRVDWFTSRLGIVTPVAVINPVNLSGAMISNVTLHNLAHVEAFNIKVGDEIEIVRSGEVIPKFLRTVSSSSQKIRIPTECPSCQSTLTRDDIRLYCPNRSSCPAQRLGRIVNWVSCVEIEDLSDKRLQLMIDRHLIQGIADLYRLSEADLLKLPQTKEKMAKKLYDNITKSRTTTLSQFLNGLGISGVGLTSWEKIIDRFGSLERILLASKDEIAAIDGFADKSAEQILTGLQSQRALIDELLRVGVTPTVLVHELTSESLKNASIAITGALSVPRSEIEKLIKSAGGHPSSSVSKNTFAVVTNDPSSDSSKMKKARELGLKIWSEDDLRQFIATPGRD
jgi:DNA ligase (NAD+)